MRLTTDKLPENLPVETITHELPPQVQICPDCGEPLHVMGHESRHELKIIPAQVVILEHVSDIYSCRNCEANSDHVPVVYNLPKKLDQKISIAKVGDTMEYEEKLYSEVQSWGGA